GVPPVARAGRARMGSAWCGGVGAGLPAAPVARVAGGGTDRFREDMKVRGSMSDHLFSGLKVIDCASWIAGPAAATIMSDFGADVIKIEPPGAGDPWRGRSASGANNDYYWQLTSRNKRSLALDLKHKAGRDILYRLVDGADVLGTNFPLPVRDRL